MTSNLQLVKSTQFNGIQFDCYAQDGQQDISDFWATRTQIGQLLEYENPKDAIKDIHLRNKERLDRLSTERKLRLLEICRYRRFNYER